MSRAKSLILSESALYNLAVASVTDQEERHHREAPRRYSSFNLESTSDDNAPIIEVAKTFLSTACPELLALLDAHYDQASSRDRLVKIGRNVNATLRELIFSFSSCPHPTKNCLFLRRFTH